MSFGADLDNTEQVIIILGIGGIVYLGYKLYQEFKTSGLADAVGDAAQSADSTALAVQNPLEETIESVGEWFHDLFFTDPAVGAMQNADGTPSSASPDAAVDANNDEEDD